MNYTLYGFGCVLEEEHPIVKSLRAPEADLKLKDLIYYKSRLRYPSESDTYYLVFDLIECGNNIATIKIENIPKTAYKLTDTIRVIKKFCELKDFSEYEKKWDTLQKSFREIGYELPQGEIIVIHDFD